jgi:cytidine deaminase
MIAGIDNIRSLLESPEFGIFLDDKVYNKIVEDVENCESDKFHVSILLDMSSNLICYGYNIHYNNNNNYPFSLHAEINCLNKYYSKKIKQYIKNREKILLVLRLSKKIKKLGESKPCSRCHNYLINNTENINIKKIIYSTPSGFEVVKSSNLYELETILSSGYRCSSAK